MHYTYLIGDGSSRTKIGHSNKPHLRLSQLGVSTADKLSILHTWKGARERQVQLERDLHEVLRWGRIKGEWFSIEPDEIRHIGDLLLGGEAQLATELSAMMEVKAKAMDDWLAATRRRVGSHARWHREERDAAREEEQAAWVRMGEAEAVCLALGLPDKDWTKFAGEPAPKKARQQRTRAAAREPVAPADPEDDRPWGPVQSPTKAMRPALRIYFAQRGMLSPSPSSLETAD